MHSNLVLFDVCPPQFSHLLAANVLGIITPHLVYI